MLGLGYRRELTLRHPLGEAQLATPLPHFNTAHRTRPNHIHITGGAVDLLLSVENEGRLGHLGTVVLARVDHASIFSRSFSASQVLA